MQPAQPVIHLDNVGVRYRVAQERIASLKEYTIRRVKGQVRYHDFWALQEVNLSIQPGEVFGIIGPNGAGKSTLLKVIARVLRPTRGRVRIRGRLAPLLELGAGFDPELTGRENVYLNGAILGYTKAQIDSLYDEIVDFSGLRDFIEAPLRTYSTGMYARLGFAVATAQQPDILIVDEILGVGDAEFQTKSFERIQGFRAAGATILLVSHSLERVQEVCSRAMWLDRGQMVSLGTAQAVVGQYLEHNRQREAQQLSAQRQAVEQSQADSTAAHKRWGTHKIEITSLRITDETGAEKAIFETGSPLHIHLQYHAHETVQSPLFGIAIHRQDGTHITGPNTGFQGLDLGLVQGSGVVRLEIPSLPLLENLYYISAAVVSHDDSETYDFHERLYPFRVLNQSQERQERYGLVTVQGSWQHERLNDDRK